jgi:formyltetrahydrofolate deformylase
MKPMRASFPETADRSARYVLTLAVTSAQGQAAAMVALREQHGAYIEEFAVFDDTRVSRFYVRS